MDSFIRFYRDFLDGPLYIVVAVISGILICSCIGYLAEQSLMKKKAVEEYRKSYASVDNSSSASNGAQAANSTTLAQAAGMSSAATVGTASSVVAPPPNAVDIQPSTSGIPTAVGASQPLTATTSNNSQNVGQ